MGNTVPQYSHIIKNNNKSSIPVVTKRFSLMTMTLNHDNSGLCTLEIHGSFDTYDEAFSSKDKHFKENKNSIMFIVDNKNMCHHNLTGKNLDNVPDINHFNNTTKMLHNRYTHQNI